MQKRKKTISSIIFACATLFQHVGEVENVRRDRIHKRGSSGVARLMGVRTMCQKQVETFPRFGYSRLELECVRRVRMRVLFAGIVGFRRKIADYRYR